MCLNSQTPNIQNNWNYTQLTLKIIELTSAERHARKWGVKPSALSSRTLCCVGLVFCQTYAHGNILDLINLGHLINSNIKFSSYMKLML